QRPSNAVFVRSLSLWEAGPSRRRKQCAGSSTRVSVQRGAASGAQGRIREGPQYTGGSSLDQLLHAPPLAPKRRPGHAQSGLQSVHTPASTAQIIPLDQLAGSRVHAPTRLDRSLVMPAAPPPEDAPPDRPRFPSYRSCGRPLRPPTIRLPRDDVG